MTSGTLAGQMRELDYGLCSVTIGRAYHLVATRFSVVKCLTLVLDIESLSIESVKMEHAIWSTSLTTVAKGTTMVTAQLVASASAQE